MSDPYFFGYGSLVNRRTHDYGPSHPASLPGWRREWRATTLQPQAFLTAAPEPGSRIDGLIAPVPGADWAALDLRERGYQRHPRQLAEHPLDADPDIAVYAIPRDRATADSRPILLSYLDVVVQGFLDVFGESGVGRFFDTTANWHLPIADDRALPRYPRAQSLTDDERRLTDTHLARLGARVIPVTRAFERTDGRT